LLVHEVKAMLNSAVSDVDNAVQSLYRAKEQLNSAYQQIMLVRATSQDALGIPTIQQMLDDIDKVIALKGYVTESVDQYTRNI
jgi:hypothetical protein